MVDAQVARLAQRIRALETGLRAVSTTPQLDRSAIMDGWLSAYVNNQISLRIGLQHDGTSTTGVLSGPTPPTPTLPFVKERAGGLTIYWDGTFVDSAMAPMDFSRVTVHAVESDGFSGVLDPTDQTSIVGEMASATGGEVTVGLDQVEYLVFLVAWSQAGKFSTPSEPGMGTPLEGELVVDTTARELAQAALDAANAAAAFAESAVHVFYQTDEPAAEDSAEGYQWFDTDDGNHLHVYQSGAWVDARDAGIAGAISAAAAAETAAESAATSIDDWTFTGTTDIDGGQVHADSIAANQIAANAITSKHTITGALFQTTTTAARGIKFGSAGLTAWNSSGTSTFTIDAATGNVTLVGSLTAGSSVTGAIVTGGVVQTTTTASRGIKLNTTNLIAYNSSGSPTFSIDATTGNVSMLGSLTSGSSIAGASINASTITTSYSGERVALGLMDETYSTSLGSVSFFGASPYDLYPGSIRADGLSSYTTPSALVMYPPSSRQATTYRPHISLVDIPTGVPQGFFNVATGNISIQAQTIYTYGSSIMSGALSVSGRITASSDIVAPSLPTTSTVSPNLVVSSPSGTFFRYTGSSRNVKYDIEPLEDSDILALESCGVFTYHYYDDPEGRLMTGFVVEDMLDAGLRRYVDFDENGMAYQPAWAQITPLLAAAYKRAASRLSNLETRIATLEAS